MFFEEMLTMTTLDTRANATPATTQRRFALTTIGLASVVLPATALADVYEFTFHMDYYLCECTYQIKDTSGNTIASIYCNSGIYYPTSQSETYPVSFGLWGSSANVDGYKLQFKLDLPINTTYTINMQDDWGDGWKWNSATGVDALKITRFPVDTYYEAIFPFTSGGNINYEWITPEPEDCNEDGIPDVEQVADGTIEDCNGNGIPDVCDLTVEHVVALDQSPVNFPEILEFDLSGLVEAADTVEITIAAVADLGSEQEFLRVQLTGSDLDAILFDGDLGADCTQVEQVVTLDAASWNAAGATGARVLQISGFGVIDPESCTTPSIEVAVRYLRVPEDCDQNGVWDECDPDRNGDGIPDACDPECAIDTDADGTPDCADDCPNWPYACSDDGLTYTVAPGESIQLALDTLPAGGMIELEAGTFPIDGFDGLVPPAAAFTLRGARDEAGELLSILDAGGFGRHLTIQTGVGPEAVIEDLVFTKGRVNTNGGSILIANGSSPTLQGCRFQENTTTQGDGGAIHLVGSNPIIENCRFLENTAKQGGGIFSSDAQPNITDCTFETNLAQVGGALVLENSDASVTSSTFRFNVADSGGAIYVGSAAPVISGCRIEENIASIVGGGLYGVSSTIDLTGSILCGNQQNQYAGEVLNPEANCILDDCGDDLDGNGVPDGCDPDCDGDGEPDAWELESGQDLDCNFNGVPDACDVANGFEEDCDENGIPDTCDIVEGAEDDNENGLLDECELAAGDLDLDGCVTGADLAVLLGLWGLSDPPVGDLNGDGIIDGMDLATLLANWGCE